MAAPARPTRWRWQAPIPAFTTVTNVSGTYTFSVWVKLVSGSGNFSLNYYSGAANSSDLETVVATTTWQRVSLTFTGDGNANSNVALMLGPSQTTAGTFEFWGAQLNSGSTADAYVPTTGSAVTSTTVTTTTPLVIGSTLTVDVTGLNSNPVANPDTAAVTEDETLVATGNVLTNDTDPLGKTLTVVAVNGTAVSATGTTTIAGTYGTLVIQANGQYTYTLGNSQADVRALANGQVVPDVFSYTVSDGNTYTVTTTQTAQNLITQSQNFTCRPLAHHDAGRPSEHIGRPAFDAGGYQQCRFRPDGRCGHRGRAEPDRPQCGALLSDQRYGPKHIQHLGAVGQRQRDVQSGIRLCLDRHDRLSDGRCHRYLAAHQHHLLRRRERQFLDRHAAQPQSGGGRRP